jgi:hypothetical protein
MDSPTSFSSLPPELVSKICHDSVLRKKDLIALRFTSKSQGIHLSASKELARRYFKNIRLVYTRQSLQTFVEICKHAILSSAVRMVQLSYTRFLPGYFVAECKRLLDGSYGGSVSKQRNDAQKDIRLLACRCDEEEDLRKSGAAKDLLAAAFTELSQLHHPLELRVSSDESGAFGQNRIYSPDNLGTNSHWECDILGTVALLFEAATLSRCVVQRLQIQGAVWNNLVDSSAHSLHSLVQLPELELNIWSSEKVVIAHVAGIEAMVIKLLNNAAGLKTLSLGSGHVDRHHTYLPRIFSTISTMRLENLELEYINLDWFKPFKNRMKSLRRLDLDGCRLNGSLKQTLLSVQENLPRLEYFRMPYICRPYMRKASYEYKGIEEVKAGINELIQFESDYINSPVWIMD